MNYKNYTKSGIHSRLNNIIKKSGGFDRIKGAIYLRNKYNLTIEDAYLISSPKLISESDRYEVNEEQIQEIVKEKRRRQRENLTTLESITAMLRK